MWPLGRDLLACSSPPSALRIFHCLGIALVFPPAIDLPAPQLAHPIWPFDARKEAGAPALMPDRLANSRLLGKDGFKQFDHAEPGNNYPA